MTYRDVILAHKKQLTDISNEIISEMESFYDKNQNEHDVENVYKEFRTTYDPKITEFNNKYNMSCPEVLVNTLYGSIPFTNSIKIYLDLSNRYKSILEKIYEKLPPLDDCLEIED